MGFRSVDHPPPPTPSPREAGGGGKGVRGRSLRSSIIRPSTSLGIKNPNEINPLGASPSAILADMDRAREGPSIIDREMEAP